MPDQSVDEPMKPELDPGLPRRRSEHGGMPRVDTTSSRWPSSGAAGLADYVPEDVPPATDPTDLQES